MFKGMPCMLKSNVGTELDISNGSTGIIHDIEVDSREHIDYNSNTPHYLRHHPVAVYIKLDTKKDDNGNPEVHSHLDGLEPNVFMVTTTINRGTKSVVKHRPKHLTCKSK